MSMRPGVFAVALMLAAPVHGAQETPASAEGVSAARQLLQAPDAAARSALAAQTPPALRLDLRRGLIQHANALTRTRQLQEALRVYDISREVLEQLGDRRGVTAALLGMGSVYGQQGDYAEAARFLRDGLAFSEADADLDNVEVAINNLGIVSRLQGEYDQALAYYQRALTLGEASNDKTSIARTLNNIGNVHLLRGSYRDALAYYQRSLALKEANGQTADIPSTVTNIGQVYERMGDMRRALEFHERSLTLFEALGNGPASRLSLERIGQVHAAEGRFDDAMRYYGRALALNQAAGSRAEIAGVLHDIAGVFERRGDLASALDHYRHSLEIREAINDRPGTADTLVGIALLRERQGDAAGAIEAATRAAFIAGDTGNREIFWRARMAAGAGYQRLRQHARARDALEEAIDTLETLRGDTAGGLDGRQRYFEQRLAPYHRLAALFIGEGQTADAFAVAERARGRVMLDMLQAGRAETRLLTAADRERERRLEREMTTALTRLWTARGRPNAEAEEIRRLEDDLRRARRSHADFRAALYDAHPVLPLSRGDAQPGTLADARTVVDARTVLLSYMVTPEVTYLFAVAEDGIHAYRIRVTQSALRQRTSRFRQQLASRDLDVTRSARELYQLLVAPAAEQLRGKTALVIVPDQALWELPFQALQSASRRYLVEDAAVSYAPSIAVLREMRHRATRAANAPVPLAAFGDPALESGLARLPDAARQVELLGRLYGANSRIFTGAEASEDRLRSAAAQASILHLATHGVLDDANPMYSFVALSGDPAAEAPRDGRLEAWEVMALNLRADVVVLAACETARGYVGAGEGVVGLSWAFFVAGAPRTVVSLWQVDAASTTDMMLAFHGAVRGGPGGHANAADALRTAALSLLRDRRYAHPFYWAAFSVVGDGF